MPVNTVLNNNDRIQIRTKGTKETDKWLEGAKTPKAREKVKFISNGQNA